MATIFTATATAADSAVAESLAVEQARTKAFETFGANTAFVGVDNVRIKINDNEAGIADGTYTAVFTTQAESQPQPPAVPAPAPAPPFIAEQPPTPSPVPNVSTTADVTTTLQREAAAVNTANVLPTASFFTDPDAEAERTNLNAAIQQGTLDKALAQNTVANQRRNPNNADWRVKLRLAPGSTYLYNAPGGAGILAPLAAQGGVIFPYTPTIQTTYKATYSSHDLTHSNYKGYYYQGSSVEPVTLSCLFTAQSTVEAEYLLAVIHFFRSVTKMFYGKDPERGTPPPLVYLTGLGEFQFNEHPCVVQSFTYDLPPEVDYIRARSPNVNNSSMLNQRQASNGRTPGTTWGGGILGNVLGGAINRIANAGLKKGAMNIPPGPASFGQNSPTYVPTKMTIAISLLPIQSRKQQSQQFSLRQYANGDLLKGGFW